MAGPKRKVSVSLDEDLVAAVEHDEDGLSATLNAALRTEVERRRRRQALAALAEQLGADPAGRRRDDSGDELARIVGLLGGPAAR